MWPAVRPVSKTAGRVSEEKGSARVRTIALYRSLHMNLSLHYTFFTGENQQ